MKKQLIAVLILATIFLSSCVKDAQVTVNTTNSNFKVELLFEQDGCKMYRFKDGGHYVYWSNCKGKTETVYNESSGKSTHEVRIQNITSR